MKWLWRNFRWVIVSMLLSLALLAGFLGWWIQQSYQLAKTDLERQGSSLFFDAIRSIEDDFMHASLNALKLDQALNDSLLFTQHNEGSQIRRKIYTDSIPYEVSLKSEPGKWRRSQLRIDATDELEGAISILFAVLDSSDKEEIQLVNKVGLDSNALNSISIRLQQQLRLRKLPDNFHLFLVDEDIPPNSLLSDTYTDLINDDQYRVAWQGYETYLFREIRPQISFAILLFLVVSGALGLALYQLAEQERLKQMKNSFISNMTHELKTPITTVGVAIEALQNFSGLTDPNKTKEYLGIAQTELQRLSILVDKVLRTSFFDQKQMPVKIEQVDLQQLVENTLSTLQLQFEERGAQVKFTHANNEHFLVPGDRLHLTNLLYNLLDNALKYSKDEPVIDIDLRTKAKQIVLQISDQGIGISQAYQQRIFERFFRAPTGDVHTVKGHGLGLSYVAGVIAAHQGKISVSSKPNEGSVFHIQLPLQHD